MGTAHGFSTALQITCAHAGLVTAAASVKSHHGKRVRSWRLQQGSASACQCFGQLSTTVGSRWAGRHRNRRGESLRLRCCPDNRHPRGDSAFYAIFSGHRPSSIRHSDPDADMSVSFTRTHSTGSGTPTQPSGSTRPSRSSMHIRRRTLNKQRVARCPANAQQQKRTASF